MNQIQLVDLFNFKSIRYFIVPANGQTRSFFRVISANSMSLIMKSFLVFFTKNQFLNSVMVDCAADKVSYTIPHTHDSYFINTALKI